MQDRFFDEDRKAGHLLWLVPSITQINMALKLDNEVDGILFWEKDIPFPKSLGNEVWRWKTLWQSTDWELPNNLLLALVACDEHPSPSSHCLHLTDHKSRSWVIVFTNNTNQDLFKVSNVRRAILSSRSDCQTLLREIWGRRYANPL